MSTKRARYDGPFDEVRVTWPPGAVHPEKEWLVQRNHWLPDDAPAKLRDELLANGDGWSEVEQSAPSSEKKKGDA
jgi:hypothetical protein